MTRKYVISALLCCASSLSSAETVPYSQAEKNGIKSCLSTIKMVSDHMIGETEHGADGTWNSKTPDNRLYTTLVAKKYSDGDSQVSLAFSPNDKGGCDAVYVESFASAKNCTIMREEVFGSWKYRGSIGGTVILTSENGSVDVYLSPQENNTACLASKRETVFN